MCPLRDRRTSRLGWCGAAVSAAAIGWAAWQYATRLGEVPGPWTWPAGSRAVAADAVLFSIFAVHHSVFARIGFKAWLIRRVPARLERTTYVVVASALFALVCSVWRQVPGLAWQATAPASPVLQTLQIAGIVLTVYLVRQSDALTFVGVRPAPPDRAPVLRQTGLYARIRHPLYVAWLLIVWPAPVMTGSRLTFAALSTLYLLIAIPLEERSLDREFGEAYAAYRRRVRWRLLPGLY